jgi:transcriptional antiterminator
MYFISKFEICFVILHCLSLKMLQVNRMLQVNTVKSVVPNRCAAAKVTELKDIVAFVQLNYCIKFKEEQVYISLTSSRN